MEEQDKAAKDKAWKRSQAMALGGRGFRFTVAPAEYGPQNVPSSLSSPSIIAHLNTTLSHVPSSPSSRQARPRPAFFKASLLQWTAPITHPPSPLSHLPSPPYCCSLPPFFIFTSILNLDLQNLEPPPQSPWGITSSLPTPSFWWEPAQAQYAPPWKRSELSVPQRGWS